MCPDSSDLSLVESYSSFFTNGFFLLPNLIKGVGVPFSYLPRAVGAMEIVRLSEIQILALPIGSTTETILLDTPGRYIVQTDNPILHRYGDTSSARSWLTLTDEEGTQVDVYLFSRAIRPYDTNVVAGHPSVGFVIDTAGEYQIEYPQNNFRPTIFAIIPDKLSGHETSLNLWYAGQIIALVAAFILLQRRRNMPSKSEQVAKRDRDDTMNEILKRRKQNK